MKILKRTLLVGWGLLALAACGPEPPSEPTAQSEGEIVKAGMKEETGMVAYVDGSGISEELLALEARKVTGSELDELDADAVNRLMDAVIMRRALALKALNAMDAAGKAWLDTELEAYREQLLVKQYLAERASVQPVTDEMVRAYYKDNRDRYTTLRRREYQILVVDDMGGNPQGVLKALESAKTRADWGVAEGEIEALGGSATLTRGEVKTNLLQPGLKRLLDSLAAEGETRLSTVDGKPYLVRLTNLGEEQVTPLSEVSASIRRALSATQVKRAIKQVGDRVLEETAVERVEATNNQAEAD